jgi:hypothetical protein
METSSFDSCKILLNRPRTCSYLTGRLWFSYNVGEEVVVGVEAELRGDEGGGRLRWGCARAGGVGPYVLVLVHGFCSTVARRERAWVTASSLDDDGVGVASDNEDVAAVAAPYT